MHACMRTCVYHKIAISHRRLLPHDTSRCKPPPQQQKQSVLVLYAFAEDDGRVRTSPIRRPLPPVMTPLLPHRDRRICDIHLLSTPALPTWVTHVFLTHSIFPPQIKSSRLIVETHILFSSLYIAFRPYTYIHARTLRKKTDLQALGVAFSVHVNGGICPNHQPD